MTFAGWDVRLLEAMGLRPTPARLAFLRAWQAMEGGQAHNNPLNTTLRLPGSTAYNSAGVQHYTDPLMGLAATILTLRLSYYAGLRGALGATDLTARQIAERGASGLDKWGTGARNVERYLSKSS